MKTSITILSVILLGVLANAYSPNVALKATLPDAFVKQNEVYNVDLSDYFGGYNLTFTTNNSNVTVQPPLSLLAAGPLGPPIFAGPQTFVSQTYPRDKTGNIDYTGYVLYLTLDNYLYWANASNYTSVPSMVYGFQLTPLQSAHCFNAAQIDKDLVIVDCSSRNITTGIQTDWFFYVSLSKKVVVATFSEPATTNTTYSNVTGTATRGVRVVDFGNKNRFIFRYVGSDAISNPLYQNASFVEVYKALNWTQPKAYTVISRGALGIASFYLTGFEVLNGALFILNSTGSVFYIQNFAASFDSNVTNVFTFPTGFNLLGFAASIEYYRSTPQLTLLAYTNNLIWEINWSNPAAPTVVQNYTFGQDVTVLKADYSADYVYAHVNSTSFGTKVVIFKRGSTGFFQLYKSVTVTNLASAIWWSLDRNFNNLLLWDVNITQIHNFHFQKKLLLFKSTKPDNGNVTVTGTSVGSDGLSISYDTPLKFVAIKENDFSLYLNTTMRNLTLEHPSTYSTTLDGAVIGPGVNYTAGSSPPFKNYNFQSFGTFPLVLPAKFAPQNIFFHKIAPNASAPGSFSWLVQADAYILYNLACVESINPAIQSPSLNCSVVGSAAIPNQVTRLVIQPDYITVISADAPSNVIFYLPNLTVIANVSTSAPCVDLVLSSSGKYIACSQPSQEQIVLWSATHPSILTQFAINRTQLPRTGFPIFSPTDLFVSPTFQNYLFVKNGAGVIIFNIALVDSLGVAEVASTVTLPPVTSFDFLVNGNSLLFFILSNSTTYIQEYLLNDPANPLFVKQYTQFFDYQFQTGPTSQYSSANTNRFFSIVQDNQYRSRALIFAARQPANANYITSLNLTDGGGAVQLAGVHSSILRAEYLIFGNGDGNLSAFVIYDQTFFNFGSYLNDPTSTSEKSSFTLNAVSSLQSAQPPFPVTFSIMTYNLNPKITPGKRVNDSNALNFVNFTTNRTSFVFNPEDFFSGVITNWKLTPQNASDNNKITLQAPVTSGNTAFNASFKFLDLALTDRYIYGQGNRTLVQINASNTSSVLNIVDMTVTKIIPKYQRCSNLVVDSTYNFTTSFCMDILNNIGYLVTVSFLSSSPSPLPAILTPLTSVNSIRKIGDLLFLLENPNGQVANPGSKLHVYDYSLPATPNYTGYLSGGMFGAKSFQVGSFDYVNLTTNYYRFYLTDGNYGIRTIEYNASTNLWVNPQSYSLLNDANFQNDNIPYNALFLGLAILQPVNASVSNDTYVALTTDTYNSYYVKLTFSPTGALNASLLTVYKRFTAAVNLPKITTVSSTYTYFAVSSYDNNSGKGLVTLYNATNSNNQASMINSFPYPASSEGSRAFALLNQGGAIKFWAYAPVNTASVSKLRAANTGSIQEYQITPFFAINVAPNSNITSTYVNLTGSNNGSSQTVSFNITYTSTPTTGSSKWWIWLVVILGLLIIGGGIYAFIKYRNKRREDDLTNMSLDANAPLTTNYA